MPKFLTTTEAAKRLGVTTAFLRGNLLIPRTQTVGGHLRFAEAEIEDLIRLRRELRLAAGNDSGWMPQAAPRTERKRRAISAAVHREKPENWGRPQPF